VYFLFFFNTLPRVKFIYEEFILRINEKDKKKGSLHLEPEILFCCLKKKHPASDV